MYITQSMGIGQVLFIDFLSPQPYNEATGTFILLQRRFQG
mgnify:FL=1